MADENKQNPEMISISEFAEQVFGLQLCSFQKELLETLYKKYKENNSIPLTSIARGSNTSIAFGLTLVIIFYDEFIGEDSNVCSNNRGAVD